MPTLTELEASFQDLNDTTSSFNGMIYGPSGVGKSVAGMALLQAITPEDKLILYLDSGEGWVSLNNHPKLNLKRRTKRVQYENLAQLTAIYNALEAKSGFFANVGGVFMDELSSMATDDLDAVTRQRAAGNAEKDPDTPAQPDYNTSGHRVRKVVHSFIRLPNVHVIAAAHERDDKTPTGGVKKFPAFTPKLGGDIRKPLHMVAYQTVDDVKDDNGIERQVRTFQVHPTKKVDAKTRVGGLNPVVTYKQLEEGIKTWLNSDRDLMPEKLTVLTSDMDATTENEEGYGPETDES